MPRTGAINVENALGALAALDALGVPLEESTGALRALPRREAPPGGARRGRRRHRARRLRAPPDRGARDARGAARALPGRRLVAVFEPRSNTSRRRVFQRDYAAAFDAADRIVVAVVPAAPIYSATGEVTELFSAEQLAADLRARGKDAVAIDGVPAIVERLGETARPATSCVTLSNGDFGGIWDALLARLGAR